MTTALDLLGIHMPDHTDKQTTPAEAGELVSKIVSTWIAPVVTGLTLAGCLGIGAAALGLWRAEPVTAAEVAQLKAETTALRASNDALMLRLIALESEGRARTAEVAAIQKSVEEIKSYSGRTMTEVTEIKIQLAEDRGAKKGARKAE